MEHGRPPGPEDDNKDDLEEVEDSSAKKREGFLVNWLKDQSELADESDDDEEDEKDEKSSKKKGVKNLFKALGFSDKTEERVEEPKEHKEEEEEYAFFDHPEVFDSQEVTSTGLGETEEPWVSGEQPHQPQESAPELPLDNFQEQVNEEAEEDEELPIPVQSNPTPPVVPPVSPLDSGPNEPPESQDGEATRNLRPEVGAGAGASAPEVNITNIENRPSLAPAVVGSLIVDRLSRNRDKKLEAKIDKHIDESDKAKKSTEISLAEQSERDRQYAMEHSADLRSVAEQTPRPKEAPEPLIGKILNGEPKREVKTPSQGFEAPKTVDMQSVTPFEAQPRNINPTEIESPRTAVDSTIAFNQAEKAAEQNIPLEGYFEKSHEIKDDPTSYRGASTVSSFGDDTKSNAGSLGNYTSQTYNRGIVPPQHSSKSLNTPMYKKAAVSGIITGLVIIGVIVAILVIG